jgi:radical SAM superfamily enzyme YgiQ (UPF0313 family)
VSPKTIRRITLLRCDPDTSNVYSGFSHPGLALPIIGTVLKNAGYEVRIFCDAIQPPTLDDVLGSDLVAFSVNSAVFEESYRLADRLRAAGLDCPIVYGGPHVTFLPEEALFHGDFVVRGEGEQTIVELVRALEAGATDFAAIRGLSWRDMGGEVRHNPDRPLEQDIDIVPDQSLIVGYARFNRHPAQLISTTGMLVSTSRGCPFKCTFCTIPQTSGTTMRYRSYDSVIEDIRRQTEFSGHRYVYFADDNFTANRKQLSGLLQAIIDAKVNIRFSAQVRADITRHPEVVDLMRAAGCYLVFVGLESINDDTLKAYQKGAGQSRRSIELAVQEFRRRSIMVHGMFVVGADEDTAGTAQRTAQWALDQSLDTVQMLPICPLPGTQVLREMDAEGRIYKLVHPKRKQAYIPYGSGNFVLYEPRQMTSLRLQEDLVEAYERFYSVRNVLTAVTAFSRKGVEPLVFRAMGRRIVRRARAEVIHHMSWLRERRGEARA